MNLSIALQALKVNKLRSGLTMLGIIIGVAAVIVMIAVGSGAQARVKEQIAGLGSNLMILWAGSVTTAGVRGGTGTAQTLVEDDAWAVMREISEIQVRGGTIISPSPIIWARANIVNSFAEAPELTIRLYFVPSHSPQEFSNSTTFGPLVNFGILS